uniref:Uncharacterized protein n=1 Tax=Vespula pensylvanica TaxID=30213 RepID=A0A834UH65_VESPE|nr:hypothetical protein H0235_001218 [Vespula pensylvanica]
MKYFGSAARSTWWRNLFEPGPKQRIGERGTEGCSVKRRTREKVKKVAHCIEGWDTKDRSYGSETFQGSSKKDFDL